MPAGTGYTNSYGRLRFHQTAAVLPPGAGPRPALLFAAASSGGLPGASFAGCNHFTGRHAG
ncbi:hypothetical protein A6M21_03535 [Desulfotomaculum copahuensis]|uniref:Uncharacterized protein n=1 Tax=Desulfotomaculum copahuensis TaxID=1838280 RepID=A0A1B7LIU8_9FIRM|nr:hypothetical protein A6M21_03535 [Desulfotomaculum copahuensis]